MSDESPLSDLVELLLQGRPDRVTASLVACQPEEVRQVAARMSDALAAMALMEEPLPAPSPLRARIVSSITERQRKAKQRSAFLVLDMLNDHLNPGGPLEVPRARAIVPALAKRLEQARQAGLPIVYVCDEHDADDPDLDDWTTHNVKGSGGEDVWPALAPRPADRVVKKSTYSAFTGSNLEAVLDDLKVDTLVLTGCLSEIGILATATDALQRGFAVEVPPDAHAGATEMAEAAAMAMLSVMPPYGAARRARMQRLDAVATTSA